MKEILPKKEACLQTNFKIISDNAVPAKLTLFFNATRYIILFSIKPRVAYITIGFWGPFHSS